MKNLDDFGFNEEQKNYIRTIMERRRDRTHKAFFDRYGVDTLEELDDLFVHHSRQARPTNESEARNYLFARIAEYGANHALSAEEYVRLNMELTQIALGKHALTISRILMLLESYRAASEPFMLGLSLASLYLFYIFGVAKLNPMEMGARFETLLGTPKYPRLVMEAMVFVRPSFQERALEMAKVAFADCVLVHRANAKGEIDHSELFFVQAEDMKKRGYDVVANKGLSDQDLQKMDYFCLNVLAKNDLDTVKEILEENPSCDYRHGLEGIRTALIHGNGSVLGFESDYQWTLPVKPEEIQITTIVDMISRSYASTNGGHADIGPFVDRDSVMTRMVGVGRDYELSYRIMEDVRKGKAETSRNVEKLRPDVRDAFRRILYLPNRAYSCERAYLYLLLAADAWGK